MKQRVGLALGAAIFVLGGIGYFNQGGTTTSTSAPVAAPADATTSNPPSPSPSPTHRSSLTHKGTVRHSVQDPYGGFRTVCQGFAAFYQDMLTHPPRERVQQLLAEAAIVDNLAGRDDQDQQTARSRHIRGQADALLAYVAAPSFFQDGNVLGKPVVAMESDCHM